MPRNDNALYVANVNGALYYAIGEAATIERGLVEARKRLDADEKLPFVELLIGAKETVEEFYEYHMSIRVSC